MKALKEERWRVDGSNFRTPTSFLLWRLLDQSIQLYFTGGKGSKIGKLRAESTVVYIFESNILKLNANRAYGQTTRLKRRKDVREY